MWPGDRMMPPLARGRGRIGGGPARLRIMTGLALASAAALMVTVVLITDRGPEAESPAGDVVRVGVVDGQSVSGYLTSSRGELGTMFASAGDTWALVSLSSYYAPDKLPGVLGDSAVAQVYARAPLPGVRTQVVKIPVYRMPGDVVAGMLTAALARDQEQADYRKLSTKLGESAGDLRLRRAYETAAQTAAAEAAAFRAHCACVFAAVVRAAPAALDRLADRPEVRVVDPAPEVRSLDRTEFRPVLPEEKGEPSPSPAVAPETPAPLPSSTGAPVRSASSVRPKDSGTGVRPTAAATKESVAVPVVPSVPEEPITGSGASPAASGR
ncbi:hypothetical protein [Actinoplanes sp. N902-109]|uniref:hypothetical protein n=1 Tax=Actinoplanes sp. (strain N902-109) TaxID=649831 RepID=UPI0003294B60|nr:hypothetical protein [Actinoplanes sp. N902-109]AGL15543.1 hypothetical protein L083_2033 [Actinoplanes sp. N902-109]